MKRDHAQPLGLPNEINTPVVTKKNTASAMDKWLVRRLLKSAGSPPISVQLWDGQMLTATAKPLARLIITDRNALYALIANPDLQFGELYCAERLRVEGDLGVFLDTVSRSLPNYEDRPWSRFLAKLYLLRRNTLSRARDNIYHHYDIGNDFYKLWLDERMVYTCAYFPNSDIGLAQAQLAKMDHVCRKLRLQPDQEVVEAGCGWGALALHMAEHYGVKVKAFNISQEQLAFARERARRLGLADRVEFVEGDYREIQGQFDAFVSIGMLEHVGFKHYGDLGKVIGRCLRSAGRGLIHSIGRNRPAPMNAWIERRIFPGAYPPSLKEMAAIFEPCQFSILDVENLRLHYVATLRHWLGRFENNVETVKAMFDEAFIRAWRLYLTGSITAFKTGELQLFQVLFNRHDNNDIPPTRHYIYSSE